MSSRGLVILIFRSHVFFMFTCISNEEEKHLTCKNCDVYWPIDWSRFLQWTNVLVVLLPLSYVVHIEHTKFVYHIFKLSNFYLTCHIYLKVVMLFTYLRHSESSYVLKSYDKVLMSNDIVQLQLC